MLQHCKKLFSIIMNTQQRERCITYIHAQCTDHPSSFISGVRSKLSKLPADSTTKSVNCVSVAAKGRIIIEASLQLVTIREQQ